MQPAAARGRRSFWLKHLHRWHWISAATSLVGMLLFAATGITLNHAAQIEAKPVVTVTRGQLPEALVARLAQESPAHEKAALPAYVTQWLAHHLAVSAAGRETEWSPDEIYLSLPRPGGDAWLTIGRSDGAVRREVTDRGWIAWLNDLHKGRNAGSAWSGFIDVFAVACLVFCTTGLFLLQLHSGSRAATWPLVGLGLVAPLLLALLFIH